MKLVVGLGFPDALAAATLAGFDHDGVADLLGLLETLLEGVNARLSRD